MIALRRVRSHIARSRSLIDQVQAETSASEWPEAVVVLCLKGLDPDLLKTIDAVCTQDYPAYSLTIVVDSPDDEAVHSVEELDSQYPSLEIRCITLDGVRPTCTRKLSSILQAWEGITPETDVVVHLDADTVPTKQWLRSMVAMLQVDGVGVSTGVRRYFPSSFTFAGIIRSYWSAFATNWTLLTGVGWGGSLAIRAEHTRSPDLRRRVSHAFSEDTTISEFVLEHGEEVRVVPDVVLVNHDDCTEGELWGFLRRQLFAVKLHHRGWRYIAFQGLNEAVCICIALFYLATARGSEHYVTLLAATLYFGLGVVVVWAGKSIGTVWPPDRPRHYGVLHSMARFGRLFAAIFAMPFFYAAVIVSLYVSATHCWRGVSYRLRQGRPVETLSVATQRPPQLQGVAAALPESC